MKNKKKCELIFICGQGLHAIYYSDSTELYEVAGGDDQSLRFFTTFADAFRFLGSLNV
jgi:hypothetical protein